MAEVRRRTMLLVVGGAAASAAVAGISLTGGRPTPLTRGRGQWTSFGTVAVLASARLALVPSAEGTGHEHAHGGSFAPVPSVVHGAWTDAVVVDVQVHNGSRSPMELSPGQFRVRVDGDGPTVSLYSSDRAPGPVGPGSTTTMRISYLVPPIGPALSMEFADAAGPRTHHLGRIDGGRGQS